MKKVLIGCFFLSHFFSVAQTTVQFSDPLPPNYSLVSQVDKLLFGSYKNENSGTVYLFNEEGISIVSTIIAYVTREQIRESSSLEVRGDFLFGIKENDSLPCVLEGERFYYGIQRKDVIVGSGSGHQLTKLDARSYLVNFLEGIYFEPSLFRFENGNLIVVHGDLNSKPFYSKLLKVNSITRYNSPVDVLAPSETQWSELKTELFGGEKLVYGKE